MSKQHMEKVIANMLKNGYFKFSFMDVEYTLDYNLSTRRLSLKSREPRDFN